VTDTAKRYGESFFDLAAEEKIEAQILEELKAVVGIFAAEPDYIRLLSSPKLPKKDRSQLIADAFRDQLHPYCLNFLRLLCDNSLLNEFSGCVEAFRACFNRLHDIVDVSVVSAVALDDSSRSKLIEKLESVTGKKVDLHESVNPALIGGIRLEMDGKRYDGTVARRLETLRSDLSQAGE